MVGTAVYQVGRKPSSQPKKRGAKKPGVQTTLPPAASDASSAVPIATTSDFLGTETFDKFTPRASVSFKPTDDHTLYLTVRATHVAYVVQSPRIHHARHVAFPDVPGLFEQLYAKTGGLVRRFVFAQDVVTEGGETL